jgi:hypothetical protein
MRRFIITNSGRFNGTIELLYNDKGTLCLIDMRNADICEQTQKLFLHKIPSTELSLVKGEGFGKDTEIVEVDIEITFEMFWNTYAKKINRKRCEQLWNKLSQEKQVKAIHGIHAYNKYLSKESWRNKLDPDTYLRNESWENEWK